MSSHEPGWYVRHEGKSGGPFAASDMSKALQAGKVSGASLVRRADQEQWNQLSDVEPFASLLGKPANPPSMEIAPRAPSSLDQPAPPSVPAAAGNVSVPSQPPPLPSTAPVAQVQVQVIPQVTVPAVSGVLETKHTMPGAEQTIWEGPCSIYYYVARFAWSGLWVVIWLVLAGNATKIESWIKGTAPEYLSEATEAVPESGEALSEAERAITGTRFAPYLKWAFLLLALWALWGLIRRVLQYFNTYYVFTTQRIKIRRGILSRDFLQIELFRLKDYAVKQTFWGRLLGYTHIEITSGDRLVPRFRFVALPGGLQTAEKIREMMQHVRSQSGAVAMSE